MAHIDEILDLLRQCGIQHGEFDPELETFRIPVNPTTELRVAYVPHDCWADSLFTGGAHYALENPPLPRPLAIANPEDVAVFILRCLFRAGAKNDVAHPYVRKKQD